ncbi:hypothetical protein HDU79_002905 [Rhizoclosmatium sp. JEL0117]|nr:hypothetical protein HDU79_002905 [Rhizoclosmatium sp. JEL0117]
MIVVHFASLCLVPFLIGFHEMIDPATTSLFDSVITVVYVMEAIISLLTPKSEVRSRIYSIREYELMRPYLSEWIKSQTTMLFFDVLSALPLRTMFSSTIGCEFLLLLRLIRIIRLPFIVKRCAYFARLRTHTEKLLGVGGAKIVPIGLTIFVFIHYNACMLYYAGRSNGFVGWETFWFELKTASLWDSYVLAFLLGVGNMFPMSFKPQTVCEQMIDIFFIFIGAGLYAILVGYISSAAISFDNSGRLYNQKMEELIDYIKWKKLSPETRQKLISYYETKYRGKYFEEDTLLADMNESLRTEISLQNTRSLIMKVPFLRRETGDHRDEIFYSRIASALHARYYIPGDSVTKQGESGADMFFILSGKVDVFVDGNFKVSLYDGSYFGERKPSLGKLNSRTTWSGSTLNTNYRVSTWPALGPPKGKSGKQMKEATVENDQTVANQTHISAPPHVDADSWCMLYQMSGHLMEFQFYIKNVESGQNILQKIRKHYIEDAAFVARKKTQYAQPSYIKAEYIYESPIQKKLWSSRAKKVIGDMPTEFNMPIDQDLWRLKRLAADLERRVIQTFPPSVFSLEKIRGSVACFVGVPNQYSPLQNNSKFATAYNVDSQISLALLILSSLIDEFPVHLAQSALEHIFEANEENGKRKQHWAQRPISPLLWRVQERLEYLGLLIASIDMNQAINPNPNSAAKTSPEVAQLLLLTANPNNRPEILSRLEPFRQIHLMMHEVLYSMKLDTAFTHFSFTDFEPLPSMYPPPTLKHHTTTTPLLSNTTLLSYIRTTPNLSQHYHPKHSTTLISHALVQLEVIPFLVRKSANVPAVEFLELFPGVQRVLEHVAGMALRLCVQRGDCPASIGGGVLEKRMRSKSRSRSRSAVRRSMGSAGESFGIYEKVLKISMEGVMSAREIQAWTSSEDKFGQVAKAEKGNGSGDEGDEDEEDEPVDEFASSLDGLVFQIKLRILEAVDDIIRIVYGEVEEPVYRFAPPPKTPEPIYRKADSPEPQQVLGAEEHNDNEEDEEMRMFDLLRHLRIAKHHRDPVPSSLVMKGKKI